MMTKYYDLPNTIIARVMKALVKLRPTTEYHGTWMTVTVRGTKAEIEALEAEIAKAFR